MKKICVFCGKEFYRRPNEPPCNFAKRQKCVSNCKSLVYKDIFVGGGHDTMNRPTLKPSVVMETVFWSRTWVSQSRHWRKFHT